MRNIVVCFPIQQSELVESYLVNRQISNYELVSNLQDAEDVFNSLDGEKAIVYLFDFVNEVKFFEIYKEFSDSVKYMQVVTTKNNIAELYREVTDAIYYVRPMMDLASLFWDSKIFKYENAIHAAVNSEELIELEDLKTVGLNITSLDLNFKVVRDKSGVDKLKISGVAKGTSINESETPVVEKMKRKIARKLKFSEEEDKGISEEEVIHDIQYGDLESAFGAKDPDVDISEYLDEVPKPPKGQIERRMAQLTKALNNAYFDSVVDLMLKKNYITQDKADILIKLRTINKLRGTLGEVNYAVDHNWISETDYLKIISEYYKFECLSSMEVENSSIDLVGITLSTCINYNCFPIESLSRDTIMIIVDYDNQDARRQMELIYNNCHFLYARDKHIKAKLESYREDRRS